ncbi:CbiZ domain containing protein [Vulcanisaeta moutnovskia 768-28]|uniref:CbiZ domain containing protein n=1 Tax=Vulcanisaeta moutnovskia (strain 768-28) TaxID=985053 RepID=F0QVT1_VULM7|nr:adenosylcobinamide amidohydrolase [Vulcanisaeta moutnovskia]ADY02105.1 CbiZ domain containing protein [Vulcanisaeta moutnovskia 768-28]
MIIDVKYLRENVVITLNQETMALASTVDGGLRNGIKYVIHHQVPKDFNNDPIREVMRTHRKLTINSNEAITFLTATEIPRNHVINEEIINGVETEVSITMGLTNPYRINKGGIETRGFGESTINMAIIIDRPLTIQAMIDVTMLAAQIKALTLAELTGNRMHGTTSDAIAILTPINGNREPYAGPATAIGRAVVYAIRGTLIKAYEIYRASPEPSGDP